MKNTIKNIGTINLVGMILVLSVIVPLVTMLIIKLTTNPTLHF